MARPAFAQAEAAGDLAARPAFAQAQAVGGLVARPAEDTATVTGAASGGQLEAEGRALLMLRLRATRTPPGADSETLNFKLTVAANLEESAEVSGGHEHRGVNFLKLA